MNNKKLINNIILIYFKLLFDLIIFIYINLNLNVKLY